MVSGVRLVVLGKQGAGKGTQCVRLSHHYVVPARLDGRHAARRREVAHPARPCGPRRSWTGASSSPTSSIMEMVDQRLAEPDTPRPGLRPRRRPRTIAQAETLDEIARPRRASTSWSTSTSPTQVVLAAAGRPPGLRRLRHQLLGVRAARPSAGSATSAAARSSSARTTPRRPSRRRLELYERQTEPLLDFYRQAGIARHGQRHRLARRASPAGWSGPSTRAADQGRPPSEGLMRRNKDELAKMRRAGVGRGRDARGHPGRRRPGATTAELDARGARGARPPGRHVQLPGLRHPPFPAVICTSLN